MTKQSSVCAGGDRLIFACSGAADVGEISDKVARKLMTRGQGQDVLPGRRRRPDPADCQQDQRRPRTSSPSTAAPLDCAKITLEQIGCTGFRHVRITDLGMEKGKTPATDANVERAAAAIRPLLG